jgi:hypothetical protein
VLGPRPAAAIVRDALHQHFCAPHVKLGGFVDAGLFGVQVAVPLHVHFVGKEDEQPHVQRRQLADYGCAFLRWDVPKMQLPRLGLVQIREHLPRPATYIGFPFGPYQDSGHDQPFGRTARGPCPDILESGSLRGRSLGGSSF